MHTQLTVLSTTQTILHVIFGLSNREIGHPSKMIIEKKTNFYRIHPLLRIIHLIISKINDRINGYSSGDSYIFRLDGYVTAEITNPFRGLVALIGASKVIDTAGFLFLNAWGQVILHFIWSIGFWFFSHLGISIYLISNWLMCTLAREPLYSRTRTPILVHVSPILAHATWEGVALCAIIPSVECPLS